MSYESGDALKTKMASLFASDADRDVAQLAKCANTALTDYRDILAWAESPRQMRLGPSAPAAEQLSARRSAPQARGPLSRLRRAGRASCCPLNADVRRPRTVRRTLLYCGILAALCYVVTDIASGMVYPEYSFTDQAVSELFAIGAPTSAFVVPLFGLSSLLSGAFAVGVWKSSGGSRLLRTVALMFGGSALVAVVLWNLFPMHMRGAELGFTDTMHVILSTNPFVLLSIVLGAVAFRGPFRLYTVATIVILPATAISAFRYAPELQANLPTPGLGLMERVAQYAYELWQMSLAVVLLRGQHSETHRSKRDA